MSKESLKNKKIVAICACTAGMAHTYIAKQKLKMKLKSVAGIVKLKPKVQLELIIY